MTRRLVDTWIHCYPPRMGLAASRSVAVRFVVLSFALVTGAGALGCAVADGTGEQATESSFATEQIGTASLAATSESPNLALAARYAGFYAAYLDSGTADAPQDAVGVQVF